MQDTSTVQKQGNWARELTSNPDGGNVFQMAEMAETKRRGGWVPHYEHLDNVAVTILRKKVPFLGEYWYLPKGPGVTNVAQLKSLLPELQQLASKSGAFIVKIEPEIIESDEAKREITDLGFIPSPAVQPNVSTVLIDLSPDLDTVLASLNQKGRHALKRAERDGVTAAPVELSDENMRKMFDLLNETASGRFESSIRDYEYYREFWQNYTESGHGQLFFAHYEGKLVAAAYCMYLGQKGLYKDGASIREKTAYGASHLLQWEVIKWMKAQGVTSYDLCGAPHSSEVKNESNKFYGIGRFKTSFNKQVTDYVSCYDFPIRPLSYKIWQHIGRRVMVSYTWRFKHQQWF